MDGGGLALGLNGGRLLYLAIGGCLSNDLVPGGDRSGDPPDDRVRVIVRGDFSGDPAVSDPVAYDVELAGEATRDRLEEPVAHVDAIAEIPNSVRKGTEVKLAKVTVVT